MPSSPTLFDGGEGQVCKVVNVGGGGCRGESFLVSSTMAHLIIGLGFEVQNQIKVLGFKSKFQFLYLLVNALLADFELTTNRNGMI